MFITIGVYTGLYSFSLFLPTIVKDLGYTEPKRAQLMTVPPYVVACFFCVSAGWLADKLRTRGVFMIGFQLTAYVIVRHPLALISGCANKKQSMVGSIMLIASNSHAVKYAGCFFLATGIYPNVPQGVAWNGNNIGGSLKRGVGIAMHVGFGNLGGTISGYLFLSRDGPRYLRGHSTLLAFQFMACCLTIFMTLYLRKENARRDREYKAPEEYSEDEKVAEREKGDNATFFRYTV